MKVLSYEQIKVLYLVSAISASLSLIGNLFIIILFCSMPSLRLYVFRLVFYISICDSIKSITLLIPGYLDSLQSTTCKYQGYFFASSALGGTIWVLAIAWNLNQVLIKNHHNIEFYHKRWFFFAMAFPAILSVCPFLTQSYGLSSAWCTIKEDFPGKIWKFYLFYLPSWIIIFLTIVIYVKIGIKSRMIRGFLANDQEKSKLIKRVVAYPLIMIFTFLPITFVRIQHYLGEDINFYFMNFAYFSYAISGFANSIAYGYNEIVIRSIKESFFQPKINASEIDPALILKFRNYN